MSYLESDLMSRKKELVVHRRNLIEYFNSEYLSLGPLKIQMICNELTRLNDEIETINMAIMWNSGKFMPDVSKWFFEGRRGE